jgi:hypothetical protein
LVIKQTGLNQEVNRLRTVQKRGFGGSDLKLSDSISFNCSGKNCYALIEKYGSSLPGVGRIDEPDTFVGAFHPHTPNVRWPGPPPEKIQ